MTYTMPDPTQDVIQRIKKGFLRIMDNTQHHALIISDVMGFKNEDGQPTYPKFIELAEDYFASSEFQTILIEEIKKADYKTVINFYFERRRNKYLGPLIRQTNEDIEDYIVELFRIGMQARIDAGDLPDYTNLLNRAIELYRNR